MTQLSADRPNSNSQDDHYGYAPFAESLANSICRYPGNEGMVLALYGPWGSGKSTVLSYVKHFLKQRSQSEQPVIVTFNPWWTSGQENLACAFLGQVQAGDKFLKEFVMLKAGKHPDLMVAFDD